MIYHWHHIVPKHAGGTDDPDNLVRVTIEEHAELHLARYLEHGEWGDYIAAMTLSGQMSGAEAAQLARAESCRNRVWTQDSKRKVGEWSTEYHTGRKRSDKARANLKAGARNRTTGNAVSKPITCLTNGRVYATLDDAAADTGVGRASIHRAALGSLKKHDGHMTRAGFAFYYK